MMPLLAHGDFAPFSGWTFVLRFGQYLLQVGPGLLAGVLLAGVLRTRSGRGWLLACLDGPPSRSMLRAVLLGLVAPVGALGALPIASEMLRSRIRPSVVLCFLVVAPLFMPWSFGHAADKLGILNASLVLVSSALLALVVGTAVRPLERSRAGAPQLAEVAGGSQVLAALRAAARLSASWLWVYVLIALGSSAALAAVLQPGAIEAHLGESATGTLFELAVPIALASIESDLAVVFASECWRIGLLTGGVFLAIQLGAAWSLGTLAWCVHRLRRIGAVASIVWLAAAMGIATVGNSVLSPIRPGQADTHAFDTLTKPYNFGGDSPATGVLQQLRRAADGQGVALAALIVLTVAGAIVRIRAPRESAAPGESIPTADSPRYSQFGVRAALVGATSLCLAASVYSYFPPSEELGDRLRLERGNLFEAVSVMSSSRRSPGEKSAAEVRALNALDRIEDALGRYRMSHAIHFAGPEHVSLDAVALRREIERSEQLVPAGEFEQFRLASIELVGRLTRDSVGR